MSCPVSPSLLNASSGESVRRYACHRRESASRTGLLDCLHASGSLVQSTGLAWSAGKSLPLAVRAVVRSGDVWWKGQMQCIARTDSSTVDSIPPAPKQQFTLCTGRVHCYHQQRVVWSAKSTVVAGGVYALKRVRVIPPLLKITTETPNTNPHPNIIFSVHIP